MCQTMPFRLERTVTETPRSILSVFVCVCVMDLLTFHTEYRIGFEISFTKKKRPDDCSTFITVYLGTTTF